MAGRMVVASLNRKAWLLKNSLLKEEKQKKSRSAQSVAKRLSKTSDSVFNGGVDLDLSDDGDVNDDDFERM